MADLTIKKMLLPGGFTKGRGGEVVKRITPHHAADYASTQKIFNALKAANISATYAICDTEVAQLVDEANRPWTSSSATNDNQAITIEVSNDKSIVGANYASTLKNGDAAGWPISDDSMNTLVDLMCDIMRRHKFPPLVVGKNLTWHSMFTATQCPGAYLLSRMQWLADTCNERVFKAPEEEKPLVAKWGVMKQVIALSDKARAESYAAELNSTVVDKNKEFYKVVEIVR